ncbi:hypothetical protein Mal64_35530 [Pseudobythopirellula maris]|uniref:Helix-turn-helix domain protein n=1 Tax=Pseudobythopirellula maris TaxID=2527991 RepID=A0A5C5ZHB0_9BACT|nr:hypothetical protein [Pseudobythopirellula maris]TWT86724.1 hypothetical protein Mal64_35530 [Pseudobythopirellula maris]
MSQPPTGGSTTAPNGAYSAIDYRWFDDRFAGLRERLLALEESLASLEQKAAENDEPRRPPETREYYSVPEFAGLVGRGEYTVREWCRMARVHAEKCDSGRGEAKSWKIPAGELQRYRDHGLLPATYLR